MSGSAGSPPSIERATGSSSSSTTAARFALCRSAVGAVVLIFPVHLLVENDVGGSLRWLWILLPLALLLLAAWAAGAAIDAGRGERSPLRVKVASLQYFLFGISPSRPRKRGPPAGRR